MPCPPAREAQICSRPQHSICSMPNTRRSRRRQKSCKNFGQYRPGYGDTNTYGLSTTTFCLAIHTAECSGLTQWPLQTTTFRTIFDWRAAREADS